MPERGTRHPDGRLCVEIFVAPGAVAQFMRWREATGADYGPAISWVVEYGRNSDGVDYIAVCVPEEYVRQAPAARTPSARAVSRQGQPSPRPVAA